MTLKLCKYQGREAAAVLSPLCVVLVLEAELWSGGACGQNSGLYKLPNKSNQFRKRERYIQRSFITEKIVCSLASAFVILVDLRGSSGRLTERVLLCISFLSLASEIGCRNTETWHQPDSQCLQFLHDWAMTGEDYKIIGQVVQTSCVMFSVPLNCVPWHLTFVGRQKITCFISLSWRLAL